MTQQVMNQKLSGRSSPVEHNSGLIRIAAAFLVLLAVLLAANRLRTEPATVTPQVSEPVFSTQIYWDMAKAHAEKAAVPMVPADAPAFYTEQYWEMAKESAAGPVIGSTDEFAYYTERYWDMAKAHEEVAAPAAPVDNEWAFYTERYWSMAQDAESNN